MPELVEKNEPPMIVKIKKINDKFFGLSCLGKCQYQKRCLIKIRNNFTKIIIKIQKKVKKLIK